MSGFVALRRETFERATGLNPIGYKIGLELICRCRCEHVVELPILFENRKLGQSKLNIEQQIRYLTHLSRLYRDYRRGWGLLLRPMLAAGRVLLRAARALRRG
jgi:dolichol-phosphate mannosyltransferase